MPNFRDNKPVGYLCVKVEAGSVYQKSGLQKGDNVTSINGQSISQIMSGKGSIDDVIELWKDFEKNDVATLIVERGDKTLTLKKRITTSAH